MATGQDLKMAGKLMFILVILPKGLDLSPCQSYAERAWPSPPKRAIRALDTRRKPFHIAIHQQWEDQPSLKGVIPSHATFAGDSLEGLYQFLFGSEMVLAASAHSLPGSNFARPSTATYTRAQRHMAICIVQR